MLLKNYLKFTSSFLLGIQWKGTDKWTDPVNAELQRCLNRHSPQDDVLTLSFPPLLLSTPQNTPWDLEDWPMELRAVVQHWHSSICWHQIYKEFRLYLILHIRKIKGLL